jgi:hypothetical protein
MFRISGIAIQINEHNREELMKFVHQYDSKNKIFTNDYYCGFDILEQRFKFTKNINTISPKWPQVNIKGVTNDLNEFFNYVIKNKFK